MTTPQTPEQLAVQLRTEALTVFGSTEMISLAELDVIEWYTSSLMALAASAQQEPVGEVVGHHKIGYTASLPTIRWSDRYWPAVGTKLYAAPVASQPVQAPPGWQTVPVEPTEAMLLAGGTANTAAAYYGEILACYRAMLGAAASHGAAQGIGLGLRGVIESTMGAQAESSPVAASSDAVVIQQLTTAPADLLTWQQAEALTDEPEVYQALEAFGQNVTNDNAVGVVLALAAHLRAAPVPMTKDEIHAIWARQSGVGDVKLTAGLAIARAIEAHHGITGSGK